MARTVLFTKTVYGKNSFVHQDDSTNRNVKIKGRNQKDEIGDLDVGSSLIEKTIAPKKKEMDLDKKIEASRNCL